MKNKVSQEGLFIPKEYLEGFDEVTIIRRENLLIIKPNNLTDRLCGRIKPLVSADDVAESYEEYLLERSYK